MPRIPATIVTSTPPRGISPIQPLEPGKEPIGPEPKARVDPVRRPETFPIGPHSLRVEPATKSGEFDGKPFSGVQFDISLDSAGTYPTYRYGSMTNFERLEGSELYRQLLSMPTPGTISNAPLTPTNSTQAESAIIQAAGFEEPVRQEFNPVELNTPRYDYTKVETIFSRYGWAILLGAGVIGYRLLKNESKKSPEISNTPDIRRRIRQIEMEENELESKIEKLQDDIEEK